MRVDFHCHIIPNVDDGSKSLEDSINMLKIAEEDGTDIIIATSHYYTYYYENKFKDIKEKVAKLNCEAEKLNIKVKVIPGQEIYLDSHILENYNNGIVNCLGEKKCMLVELPFKDVPKHALENIYELKILNMNVIIAHPERYLQFCSDIEILNSFINEGCLFQLNAGSLFGKYGSRAKKNAEFLLKNGLCDFIGSDAHNTDSRAPRIKAALDYIEEKYPDVYRKFEKNTNDLLNGNLMESEHEKVKKRKKLFGIF